MNGGDLTQQQLQLQLQLQQQQWLAMQQYQQQQQQWMAAMQYPTAMAMQPQMMYNQQQQQQHYVPYYQQQQLQYQQQHQGGGGGKVSHYRSGSAEDNNNNNKTVWIGDLQQWMDEGYLQSCFSQSSEVVSIKIIRNKQTGLSERYGFVEFGTHEAAEKVLQSYNNTTMPNTEQPFRLNWAGFSNGDRRSEPGADMSIFVGDLAPDVTDALLLETFAGRYPSVKGAKVVVDANTGRTKGYGFVRFGDENEKSRAMTEMNGEYCSSRPMRIGVATPKKPSHQQQFSSEAVALSGEYAANGAFPQGQPTDSSNTTIFVGGLDADVSDEELRQSFAPFGEVISVKIPPGKGCGFVQFVTRSSAEEAIERLNGTVIGKQTVRLSWGRNLKERGDYNQRNGNYYGRQGYNNGYGHAAGAPYANGHATE